MKTFDNIFLIGPMGSGKTTVGRYLATELQMTFFDSDKEVEDKTGAPITWIFDLEGEAGFRRREHKAIAEITQQHGIVLATGGGAILLPENRHLLTTRGFVIYLRVSVAEQLGRLHKGPNRPLLDTDDPKLRLEQLITHREPLYQEAADLVIETNKVPVMVVAQKILTYIKEHK